MSVRMSVAEGFENSLSAEKVDEIIRRVCGWALLNGVQISTAGAEFPERAEPKPFTLFPSILPAEVLAKAKSLQTVFQTLIYKVAKDHEFMKTCFERIVKVDDFIAQLWKIYETVREEETAQKVSLMLIRNDFMMEADEEVIGKLDCKHVEINTIAVGAGGGSGSISDIHRYSLSLADIPFKDEQLAANDPTAGLAKGLYKGWQLYGNERAAILYVVGDPEPNTPDQRWIERAIFRLDRSVKVIYRTFSQLIEQIHLENDKKLFVDGREVAIIYYRYGYAPEHYPTPQEYKLRLDLERSRAIKCPTVAIHLAGCKKVQQALAEPGVLEMFIEESSVAKKVKSTFVGQYTLDVKESEHLVSLALKSPERYVLKPQREGGGNNLYNIELRDFLEKIQHSENKSSWVLMERIRAAKHMNWLIRKELSRGCRNVVSELGIFGVHISTPSEELENTECGYFLRTKPEEANEGGMCHGDACLDSIFLV